MDSASSISEERLIGRDNLKIRHTTETFASGPLVRRETIRDEASNQLVHTIRSGEPFGRSDIQLDCSTGTKATQANNQTVLQDHEGSQIAVSATLNDLRLEEARRRMPSIPEQLTSAVAGIAEKLKKAGARMVGISSESVIPVASTGSQVPENLSGLCEGVTQRLIRSR